MLLLEKHTGEITFHNRSGFINHLIQKTEVFIDSLIELRDLLYHIVVAPSHREVFLLAHGAQTQQGLDLFIALSANEFVGCGHRTLFS